MDVLLHSKWLLVAILLHSGDGAGQLTPAPPTCTEDTFTFTCTVTGDFSGFTIWRVGRSSDNECALVHRVTNLVTCGQGITFSATPGAGFGTNGPTFTSTLSGTADPALNGTLVECFGPANNVNPGNMIGSSTLQIIGHPSAPALSCADLSGDGNGAVNVTVSWTLSGGDSADFHLINITTNAPQTPYGGLLNITTASVTQLELTGFQASYVYNITVRGVTAICGGQGGSESEPLTITPQVPDAPADCAITTLIYNQSSGMLLFINSIWDAVKNPVDSGEVCPGPSGNITQYQISFQTGPFETVNIARCTARRCKHTFEPAPNPPPSYDNVSVAAKNVVGVGAARTCTTQLINMTNNLLTGKVVGISSSADAHFQCTFQSGFTGFAHCTLKYGTDPTYMILPYSAESTATGTAGDSISVIPREQLNSSTVYYYTVSAVIGGITVAVRGTFTTPEYSCSLEELWDLSAVGVTFLPDVSLLHNAAQYPSCDAGYIGSAVLVNTTPNTTTVAYYSGTTAGSTACFVCDEDSGHELNLIVTERVCQSNGTWSGSPIICVAMDSNHPDSSTVDSLTTGATVGIVLACTAAVIFSVSSLVGVLIYNYIIKQRSQSPKPDSSLSHQQEQIVSSNLPQQTTPEYAEVIKMRQNRAYEQTISSSNPPQQTTPEYAEAIKMRQNRAYEQTVSSSNPPQQTTPEYVEALKMRQNRAYEQTISSSNPPQQTTPEYAEAIKMRQNRAYELTHADMY